MIKTAKAFSLIEILVVVAVIGILAVMLLPAIGTSQERALQAQTSSNLRQVGVALFSYANDHQGFFPVARSTVPYKAHPSDTDEVSWQQQLDTYIGYNGDSAATDGGRKIFAAPSSVDRKTPRAQNGFFLGSYAAGFERSQNPPPEGGENFAPLQISKIKNTSMHILAGEVGNQGQFDPDDTDKDDYGMNNPAFGYKDPKRVVQILFADGHVAGFKSFDRTVMTVRYEGVDENGLGYEYQPY